MIDRKSHQTASRFYEVWKSENSKDYIPRFSFYSVKTSLISFCFLIFIFHKFGDFLFSLYFCICHHPVFVGRFRYQTRVLYFGECAGVVFHQVWMKFPLNLPTSMATLIGIRLCGWTPGRSEKEQPCDGTTIHSRFYQTIYASDKLTILCLPPVRWPTAYTSIQMCSVCGTRSVVSTTRCIPARRKLMSTLWRTNFGRLRSISNTGRRISASWQTMTCILWRRSFAGWDSPWIWVRLGVTGRWAQWKASICVTPMAILWNWLTIGNSGCGIFQCKSKGSKKRICPNRHILLFVVDRGT